jgi:hypothetical protein
VSDGRSRDRFIEKVGCFLITIPIGAFIVTATAESLGIPPAGVFVGAAIVALLAGGFGSNHRALPPASPYAGRPTGHRPAARRSPYEQMRDIVDRYESGEISEGRRDALIREIRVQTR